MIELYLIEFTKKMIFLFLILNSSVTAMNFQGYSILPDLPLLSQFQHYLSASHGPHLPLPHSVSTNAYQHPNYQQHIAPVGQFTGRMPNQQVQQNFPLTASLPYQ